jgi:hypothetical protein
MNYSDPPFKFSSATILVAVKFHAVELSLPGYISPYI